MKLSRIVATGAAAALVGVSTLAIGGTAVAADLYVDDSDIGFVADGDAYLDSWFAGDVVGPEGTATSSLSGLEIVASAGGYQLLNGLTPTTGLVGLVADAGLTTSAGAAYFQVPVYYDHDDDAATAARFTTLYPTDAGTAGLAGQWQTSGAIFDGATEVYAARAADTLDNLVAALGPDYEILAFGAFVLPSETATLASITWNGDTHWFLPAAPTATATPASITQDDFADTGVTLTFTGYVPGENVIIGGGSSQAGGLLGTVTADAAGSVVFVFPGMADSAVDTYSATATGETSGVQATVEFTVTANPAELAETGADFTPQIIAGSAFLLVGGAFVMAARRRAIAKRH